MPKPRKSPNANIPNMAVSQLRDCAIREIEANASHVFFDSRLHKSICNYLFGCIVILPNDPTYKAQLFFRLYQHFFEGGSIYNAPYGELDRGKVLSQLKAFVQEQVRPLSTSLDDDEEE